MIQPGPGPGADAVSRGVDVRNGAIGGSTARPCPGSAASCVLRAAATGGVCVQGSVCVPARAWALGGTWPEGSALGAEGAAGGGGPTGLGPWCYIPCVISEKLQAAGTAGKHQPDSCKKGPGKALLGVLRPWR